MSPSCTFKLHLCVPILLVTYPWIILTDCFKYLLGFYLTRTPGLSTPAFAPHLCSSWRIQGRSKEGTEAGQGSAIVESCVWVHSIHTLSKRKESLSSRHRWANRSTQESDKPKVTDSSEGSSVLTASSRPRREVSKTETRNPQEKLALPLIP
jgi:hypothetical protein